MQEAPGRFGAEVAEGWDNLGAANGGYLLSIAARALGEATGRVPVTVTGHFLAPGKAGPVRIDTETVKEGRTFTTASARLSQDGRELLAALATLGHFDDDAEVLLQGAEPPAMPEPEDIPPFAHDPVVGMPPPFTARIDLRINPADAGFARGEPTGRTHLRGWFRLRDGEPIDPYALIVAADCLPPTTFNAGLPIAWTPTLELTVHLRAVPVPGWLRLDFSTRFISQGRLEVDGLIWDSADRLVAQSRQLALVPRPS
jgi:acyl-CoA thioesterase